MVSIEEASALQGCTVKRDDILINNVKAPFTCRVDSVFAQNKKVYASVVNYEDAFVEFLLPQEYFKTVKQDDTVIFSYNGDEYEGTVSYISQFITDGTVTVRLSYDDPECELLLNSLVLVNLVVEKLENAIVIPRKAVKFDSEGRAAVTVQKNEETENVFVECGEIVDDNIIIESGLYEGMMIVVDVSVGEDNP